MFKRRKKGEASSSKDKGKRKARDEGITNPLGIIFRNDAQKNRFDILSQRKIVGTRYVDDYTIETLGLKDDILWMIDRLGWSTFLSCNYPTYPRITLEFLSSLEVDIVSLEGKISFRMFNDEYSWSLDEFNSAFDFPCGGERNVPRNFIPHIFWKEISDQMENYDPSKSKASTLPNPNFKYFHRVMANTIFGRGESDGVVRNSELLMLWAAIEGVHIDSGSHFARHLMKIGRGVSGSIVIGGLLTRIATILGCDLDNLETVTRSPKINLETCLAMKWVKKEDGQYLLVLKNRFPLPLPSPTNTSIQNRGNWLMSDSIPIPPPMDLPPPPATRHEPTRHSFSIGSSAGPSSAFDFSEFRSSFERMHSDFEEQRDFLREQSRTSDERYQRVEQFMERSENFYSQAADYFQAEEHHRQRQLQEWEREEEHRLRMEHTSERLTQIYDYHVRLGSLPRMPRFPPPS